MKSNKLSLLKKQMQVLETKHLRVINKSKREKVKGKS